MIYLIEGIDRVGKSTLASKLSKSFNTTLFHDDIKPFYCKENIDINDDEIKIIMQKSTYDKFSTMIQLFKLFPNIIVDRFHLTEKVYNLVRMQNIFRFYPIDEMISKLNTILILVEPDNIDKSTEQHGSSLFNHNNLFNEFFIYSKIRCKIKIKQNEIFNDFESIERKIVSLRAIYLYGVIKNEYRKL